MKLAIILALAAAIVPATAHAQSIFGFKVGDDLRAAAKSRPQPSVTGAAGSYAAAKWSLAGGSEVSVTSAPDTGRIVYMESDWGGDPANAATDVPGMTFGVTTLADIRKRFQSNGFAFKGNLVQASDGKLVGFNCYEIAGHPGLILVLVTAQPIKDIPIVAGEPKPDSGIGRLEAVILADLPYLKETWGAERIFDPGYYPVEWK